MTSTNLSSSPSSGDRSLSDSSLHPTAPLSLHVHVGEGATPPRRAHPSDAGLDVWVVSFEERGEGLFFFETNLTLAPPQGYYVEVVPRSSIVWRGFILPNSVGIIDPSYRGTLKVPLRYLGSGDALKEAQALVGQRVVQLILRRAHACEVLTCELAELPPADDERSEGGFGSTGAV